MKRLTIQQARAICSANQARGVIILAFTDDAIGGVSYGDTKSDCKQLAYTLDSIIDKINEGHIPVWQDSMGDLAIGEENG